jgi:hypothetical protein
VKEKKNIKGKSEKKRIKEKKKSKVKKVKEINIYIYCMWDDLRPTLKQNGHLAI